LFIIILFNRPTYEYDTQYPWFPTVHIQMELFENLL